jgi:translation initiation factor IF-2
MAKTRVYELARDLNLTNQILLSKLNELDISVKSHMSSLDDEAVAKVKTVIFGKKEESIEETRVKPTVIRRRRKKVPIEVVPEPAPDIVEAAAEPKTAETAEEDKEDKEAVVEQEPVEAVEKAKTADAKTAQEPEPEEVEEKTSEELPAVAIESEPETQAVEEKPAEQMEAPVVLKEKKPKKVVKKVKRETAAKIIQLPVKPVEKPSAKKVSEPAKPKSKVEKMPPRRTAAKPVDLPSDLPGKETKKKKARLKADKEAEGNKKFLKKKISFRKKSVIEGAALYDSGYRTRKPRKGAKGKAAATGQKNSDHNSKSHQAPH